MQMVALMSDGHTWKGAIEKHGDADFNEKEKCILQLGLCNTDGLSIMNTFFQHRLVYKLYILHW